MNEAFLGLDTSNYTTSAALYFDDEIINSKKLLPVKAGEKGLRQSDAVFHHTKQLAEVTEPLFEQALSRNVELCAIGVSNAPREVEGSYMPCFLVGEMLARVLAQSKGIPAYAFSHQQGHIAAALFSADKLSLIDEDFLAFHVSGGTTEALLVSPDKEKIIKTKIVAESSDINAGQLIDRVGVMLGLGFPCGVELEKLAEKCEEDIRVKVSIRDGNPSLSGIENQYKDLQARSAPVEYIAKYAISAVQSALDGMCEYLTNEHGKLPILFSGGVASNRAIKKSFSEKYGAYFAEPAFSADNAAGVAVLAKIKHEMRK